MKKFFVIENRNGDEFGGDQPFNTFSEAMRHAPELSKTDKKHCSEYCIAFGDVEISEVSETEVLAGDYDTLIDLLTWSVERFYVNSDVDPYTIFGSGFPYCMTAEEIDDLARDFGVSFNDLFTQFHYASKKELDQFGTTGDGVDHSEHTYLVYLIPFGSSNTGDLIDNIKAPAGYTAADYIDDCDRAADQEWIDMLKTGEVVLEREDD